MKPKHSSCKECKKLSNPMNVWPPKLCDKHIKMKHTSWGEKIMSLSEMVGCDSKNPIMAFPWKCNFNDGTKHKCIKGYVCHCDDGYLCDHRAKWLVKFISTLLEDQKKQIRQETLEEIKRHILDNMSFYDTSMDFGKDLLNTLSNLKSKK